MDLLVFLMARGARFCYEVESSSDVQDQIPGRELAGVRASARAARRRDAMAVGRRSGRVATVATIGRRRWKKEAGYHRQARVENAFFRYKSIIGGGLRARSSGGRVTEAVIACNILNQMTESGRPDSYSIGR